MMTNRGSRTRTLVAVLGAAVLAACGSSGAPGAVSTSTASGVVLAEAPVSGGSVTLADSSSPAKLRTASTGADGSFDLDVAGLTPPFTLKAEYPAAGGTQRLYAVAEGSDNLDVTPITDLAFAWAAGAAGAEALFQTGSAAQKSDGAVKARAVLADVAANVAPLLNQYGVANLRTDKAAVRRLLGDVAVRRAHGILTFTNKGTHGAIHAMCLPQDGSFDPSQLASLFPDGFDPSQRPSISTPGGALDPSQLASVFGPSGCFDPSHVPSSHPPHPGFDPGQLPSIFFPHGEFDPSQLPSIFFPHGDFDPGHLPSGFFPHGEFDPSQLPSIFFPGAFDPCGDFDPGMVHSIFFPGGFFDPTQLPSTHHPRGDVDPGHLSSIDCPHGDLDPDQLPTSFFPHGDFDPDQLPTSLFPHGDLDPDHPFDPSQLPSNLGPDACFDPTQIPGFEPGRIPSFDPGAVTSGHLPPTGSAGRGAWSGNVAALYASACASCHGSLVSSTHRNTTAARIQSKHRTLVTAAKAAALAAALSDEGWCTSPWIGPPKADPTSGATDLPAGHGAVPAGASCSRCHH